MTGFTFHLTNAPPSLNNIYHNHMRGRLKSKDYKAWLTEAGYELKSQIKGALQGEFGVECLIGRGLSRADLDNLAKPIVDLLVSHKVVPDDSLLTELSMRYTDRQDVKIRAYAIERASVGKAA